MKECPNCKTQLEENSVFCYSCGVKLNAETATTCKNCGQNLQPGSEVCHNCGVVVGAPNPQPQADYAETQNTYEEPVKPKKKRKGLKLLLGIGLPVIAVLLAGVIVLDLVFGWGLLFGKKSTNPNIFYIKDGEVMGVNSSILDKPFEVAGIEGNFDDYLVNYFFAYSADGSKMYYVDDLETVDYNVTNTFYWRETNAPEDEATKIDSDICGFVVSKDGNTVIYVKGAGTRTLYRYSLKDDEKEKIANNVNYSYVSSDGERVAYSQSQKGWFVKDKDSKAEKICDENAEICGANDDLDTFYYISRSEENSQKEGKLYKKEKGKTAEKIATNVYDIVSANLNDGKFYFYKHAEQSLIYDALVKDDNKEADKNLTEVTMPYYEPTVPTRYYYESDESYKIRYDYYVSEVNEYNERVKEYNAYQKKLTRDGVREELNNAIEEQVYDLYYYDGSKEVLVKETVYYSHLAYGKCAGIISCFDFENVEKIDVADLASHGDIESTVNEKVEEIKEKATKNYLVNNSKATAWDNTPIYDVSLEENGEWAYVINNFSSSSYGDLYKVKLSDGSKELIDNEVYSVSCYSAEMFAYKKLFEKGTGDEMDEYEFYVNGDQIDINVEYVSYIEETNELYFIADCTDYEKDDNSNYYEGTLMVYKDGDVQRIADDVYDYYVTNTNELYYLADYDGEEGELYYYDGEQEKIDDEVSNIIVPFMDYFYCEDNSCYFLALNALV